MPSFQILSKHLLQTVRIVVVVADHLQREMMFTEAAADWTQSWYSIAQSQLIKHQNQLKYRSQWTHQTLYLMVLIVIEASEAMGTNSISGAKLADPWTLGFLREFPFVAQAYQRVSTLLLMEVKHRVNTFP